MNSRTVKCCFESGMLLIFYEKELIDNIPSYLIGTAIKRGKEYQKENKDFTQLKLDLDTKNNRPSLYGQIYEEMNKGVRK